MTADAWPRFVRNRSEQYEGRFASVEILSSPSLWLSGMAGDQPRIISERCASRSAILLSSATKVCKNAAAESAIA